MLSSKLGCGTFLFLVASMLNKSFYRLQWKIFFILKWFNDSSSFREHFWLYKALMALNCVPIFAKWHTHKSFELLNILERMRKFLNPELLSKLLIALFN